MQRNDILKAVLFVCVFGAVVGLFSLVCGGCAYRSELQWRQPPERKREIFQLPHYSPPAEVRKDRVA